METVDIAKLFQDNINKVLTPSGYKRIVNRDNNLSRFDILNRILIEIQYPDAYDIRTAEEWVIDNRNVKNANNGINILLPVYSHKYVDSETGNEINPSDLTLDELNAAVKYGVIHREDILETTCIKKLYDIRQTAPLDKSKYIVSKPVVKSSNLIKLFQTITGANTVYGDITYYSKSKNELTVSNQKYSDLASILIDVLVDYYIKNSIGSLYDISDFSEYDMDLLRYTMQYSLDTLLRSGRDCSFDIVRHTNNEKILLILTIVDSLLSEVSEHLDYNDRLINKDISRSVEVLKKAEALLDIMEANNISKIMKGA